MDGCTPFAPGECCQFADLIRTKHPKIHQDLVVLYSLPEKKRRKKTAKKRAVATKKPRAIRYDSTIDKLGLSAMLERKLASIGCRTVGQILTVGREKLSEKLSKGQLTSLRKELAARGKPLTD